MKRFTGKIGSLLLLFAAFGLHGCLTVKPVTVKSVDNIQVGMKEGVPRLSFGLHLHNPNNWGLRLIGAKTELGLNGQSIGSARLTEKLRLPRRGELVVPVVIETTLGQLSKSAPDALELLFGKKSFSGSVKGSLRVGKFIFRKNIFFDHRQTIDRETLQGLFRR